MNFKKWKTYFLQNRNHFDHIQWNDVSTLTPEENHLITSAIQLVQRANIPNNAGITLVDGEKHPKKIITMTISHQYTERIFATVI